MTEIQVKFLIEWLEEQIKGYEGHGDDYFLGEIHAFKEVLDVVTRLAGGASCG